MISYKTWKLLQENLGQTNLGIKSANIIGTVNEAPSLFGMMKKSKKIGDVPQDGDEGPGMAPDMGGADSTDDDDMGDEDHDDMGDDDEEDHEDDDMGDDMGDDGDEEHDHEEDDMGGDTGGDMGGPPMPKKKKPPMDGGDMGAKPPMMMNKMSYMKKEGKDTVDEKDKKQNSSNDADMLKYKQKGKCSKCSKCAMEEKEEDTFLSKLRDMTGGTKFAKDDEGFWVPVDEDTLIQPEKSNTEEAGPGEVGYAPSQKFGISGSATGSFNEWATNHVKKTRKKK